MIIDALKGKYALPALLSCFKMAKSSYYYQRAVKKGGSADNVACEGLFGRLKNEMFYGRSWAGVSDFSREIDRYIHWYNHKRINLSLGGLSPIEYRHHLGFAA